MMLSAAPIGCWDNSTRGLDAATALEFVRTLRLSANLTGSTHAVAAYQASQSMYDVFDKVVVLYEGREIYFGPTNLAKEYFEDLGWLCPSRQTVPDFLTSVTNRNERNPRPGCEKSVPRTAAEFEHRWRESALYKTLQEEIRVHDEEISDSTAADEFKAARRAVQAHHVPPKSPYTVSTAMQIKICTTRAFQRLWNERYIRLTLILGQGIMSLVIGSIFFGTKNTTSSFFAKGSTIFFAILLNALIAVTEINRLYEQRPIVEKQASYA